MCILDVASSRVRTGNPKPVPTPYEVRVDGARRGALEDVRDAISSPHIARQEHPSSLVAAADPLTGQVVVELGS
jgi:hypothetical protein